MKTRLERRQHRLDLLAYILMIAVMTTIVIMLAIWAEKTYGEDEHVPDSVVIYRLDGKSLPEYCEAPFESENINAALYASGYLREDIPLTVDEQLTLRAESEFYGVPYSVCLGLIKGESRFDRANDDGTCYGLCALHRDYFPDGLNSAENICYGIECLADKLEEYGGDMEAALTAYYNGYDDGNRVYARFILGFAEEWEEKGVDQYEEVG